VLLWGPEDERSFQRARTEADRKRLSGLLEYARDVNHCRREALIGLLDYKGEMDSPGQSCCDVCDKEAHSRLREESALEGFFYRNRRSYTAGEAAKVLARAENINWTGEDAEEAIEHLIKTGKIKQLKYPPWKNKIR